MVKVKRGAMLLFCVLALLCTASAAELKSELPNSARELLGSISPDAQTDVPFALRQMTATAAEQSEGELRAALRTSALLLAIALFTAAAQATTEPTVQRAVAFASAAAVAACCGGNLNAMLTLCRNVMDELTAFHTALLPTMATAAALSGAPESATSLYAATVTVGQLLLRLLTAVVFPAIAAYCALSTADCAIESGALGGVCTLLEKAITRIMRLCTFAFTAYLSVTGVLHGGADALAIKTAKMAQSAAVPLVGSILSDASETVLAEAKLALQTTGTFGLIALLAVLLVPFFRIAVQHILLSVTASVCGLLGARSVAKLTEAMAKAVSFYLAASAAAGLFCFVSCVCLMKVGGA